MQEMFAPEKITTEMINFWKSTALNMYGSISMLQEQAEKIYFNMMEQGLNTQKEGIKIWQEWLGNNKRTREEFGKMMEGNFERVQEFFAPHKAPHKSA